MAPPFNVPCEGREARFLHHTHWESNPVAVHYKTAAPRQLHSINMHESHDIILYDSVNLKIYKHEVHDIFYDYFKLKMCMFALLIFFGKSCLNHD